MPENATTEDRRAAILAAAARVFEAHGYAAARMDAVAAEAAVSKGSLYNYFENKEDLFTQVFLSAFNEDRSEVESLLAEAGSPRAQLDVLLDRLQERLDSYRSTGRLLLEFWAYAAREDREGEWHAVLNQVSREWQELFARVIRRGVQTGDFHPRVDPAMAARLFQALADGVITHSALRVGTTFDEAFFASLKQSVLAIVAGGPADGAPARLQAPTEQDAS